MRPAAGEFTGFWIGWVILLRNFPRSGIFHEDAVTAESLVPPGVQRADLDDVPAFLGQLHGFVERAVDVGLDQLAVDLDPRTGLTASRDEEDTTVGLDVVQVKRGRRGVLFFAAAATEGG